MLRCERGHGFDIARGGWCNLLQPQDRRSLDSGDRAGVVEARRRWLERGYAAPLIEELARRLDRVGLPTRAVVLDAGCGEGWLLTGLAAGRDWSACGIDISVAAIRAAARLDRGASWLVANADRRLPLLDASVDLVLSIFGRRNAAEFRRVLAPAGRALVVVPGADDLIELREAVQGKGLLRERGARAAVDLDPFFAIVERTEVRWRRRLDAQGLADALATTYRGARTREAERIAGIADREITLSAEILLFRRR